MKPINLSANIDISLSMTKKKILIIFSTLLVASIVLLSLVIPKSLPNVEFEISDGEDALTNPKQEYLTLEAKDGNILYENYLITTCEFNENTTVTYEKDGSDISIIYHYQGLIVLCKLGYTVNGKFKFTGSGRYNISVYLEIDSVEGGDPIQEFVISNQLEI